ncbi:hypothetical protein G6O69_01485 [Pseudenhygromyxa sp. WMMC2535]|uniref:hypothetical protein n=1 Tax=Pseudenhygromyxa sp. WMMC2535 TaxID=2712867 RepID=UPI001554E929|nr:hypothetical protein [Pseudenhygromyxa sp. WMMC2535]NVB36485.1 hypothetical protein [Pseudenhygromyxa sp. WMMC2535]
MSEACYPALRFDLDRDCFVLWLRWVAMEDPPSPTDPPDQGIRVELQLNRNPVLGPTILYRRDLDAPVYLRANAARTREILRAAAAKAAALDIQVIIHGSVANAPYAALYQLRDYAGEAIDTAPVRATPLLQVQPSVPGERWHVAGQANLRVQLELAGERTHLRVL